MATGIMVNVALIAALCAWLAWRAASPAKAVRLRNALRFDAGGAADFEWTPEHPPAGFRLERRFADPFFADIARSLDRCETADDWQRALRLAAHLTENAKDTGPIRADLRTTYDAIRAGHGYCADFVRVFIALAHAAGVAVRQWGFSFDGFGGHGHTVVEIYDRTRRKWLMIDVYNNFHPADAASGEPLGALEFRDALLGRRGAAAIVRNGAGRPGFVHEATALDYYRRGIDQWYLLWGNDVLARDGHPLVRASSRISRPLARLVAQVLSAQPRLHVYATHENADEMRRLLALRREFRVAACIALVLIVVLAVQLGGSVSRAGA